MEELPQNSSVGTNNSKKVIPYFKILLFLLLPIFLIGLVFLNRKSPPPASILINVAMIPAPDMQKTYRPETRIGDTVSKGIGKKEIKDVWDQAWKNLIALETQTYAEKPYLYAIEQYRETPRRWFENKRAKDVQLLYGNKEAARAMDRLARVMAIKEVLEDQRFKILVEETYKSFPGELFTNVCSDVDVAIGFVPTAAPSPIVPTDSLGRVNYYLREINIRLPYLNKALQQEKEKYHVTDTFIAALKAKKAMSTLMGLSDYYIGYNTPPILDEERRKFRQLDIKLAESN